MEFYGLLAMVLVVAALIFFRGSVKRISAYSEDVIHVNTAEGSLELTERVNVIADRLDNLGDYRIPDLDNMFASKGLINKKGTKQQPKE